MAQLSGARPSGSVEGANLLMMPGRDAATTRQQIGGAGVELEPPEITVATQEEPHKLLIAFAASLQAVARKPCVRAMRKILLHCWTSAAACRLFCESCHQVFWYPGAKQPGAARIQQPARNSGLWPLCGFARW
jgi:hypothetical protein